MSALRFLLHADQDVLHGKVNTAQRASNTNITVIRFIVCNNIVLNHEIDLTGFKQAVMT